MTKLVVNAKLALPGMVILAKAAFFDSIDDSDITIKYVSESLRSFARLQLDYSVIKAAVEELYCNTLSDETVAATRKFIAAIVKQLRSDPTANQNIIEMYSITSGVFAGDSKHYVVLRDRVSILGIPEITALFPISVDTNTQRDYLSFVSEFDSETITKLRQEKDPQYKNITAARRAGKTIVSDYIKQYCRTSGKTIVDYATLLQDINANQLVHSLPSGFEGYIDEFSSLYTKFGKKIAGFPSNAQVTMNSAYTAEDNCYVFTARSPQARSTTYFYTQDFKNSSKQTKFAIVEQLSKCIDSIRSKWLKKLSIKDPQFEEAMILELIYHTQARIGSSTNATLDKRSGKYLRTYGISTILHKHYKVLPEYIEFEYPGKAAFKGDVVHFQRHKFYANSPETKLIYNWLKKRANADENSRVFSTSGERVRQLLNDLGAPEGASVHKLRTLKGTLMMKERIKKHPFKTQKASVTAVNRWLKEQALEVGIQLGHMSGEKYTASTAIAHYIDPIAMLKLYREAHIAPPKTMLKLVGIDSNSIEAV
jgi:hypothetical protein